MSINRPLACSMLIRPSLHNSHPKRIKVEKPDDNGSSGGRIENGKLHHIQIYCPIIFILESGKNIFHSHRYLIRACVVFLFLLLDSLINYLMSINNNLARLISSINASHRFDGFSKQARAGITLNQDYRSGQF